MKNNVGHMRCPVCGCQTWVRENKNGILYTYCHNNHHAKLSSDDSRAAMAAINAGRSWNNGVVYLYPETKQEQQTERTQNGTNGTITTNGGIATNAETGRRLDGSNTTTGGNTAGGDDADEWDGGCGIF